MNIGIYLDNLDRINNIDGIDTFINSNILNNNISDASIFYDDIGFVIKKINCGRFNSTDLWNFSGVLITPCIKCLDKTRNIVNNINLIYYHGFEQNVSMFSILKAIKSCDKIICRTQKDADYIYRISGKTITNISENFNNLIEHIK